MGHDCGCPVFRSLFSSSRPLPVLSSRSRRIASARVANGSRCTSFQGPQFLVDRLRPALCFDSRFSRSEVWPVYEPPLDVFWRTYTKNIKIAPEGRRGDLYPAELRARSGWQLLDYHLRLGATRLKIGLQKPLYFALTDCSLSSAMWQQYHIGWRSNDAPGHTIPPRPTRRG